MNVTIIEESEIEVIEVNVDTYLVIKDEAGLQGPKGDDGEQGEDGPAGPAGQGVPTGGTTGQVLAKASSTDYDTEWVDQSGGGGGTWGSITGTLSDQTDLQSALNAKQNTITTGTTAQYFRGDLSLATFPTAVSSFTNDAGYVQSTRTISAVGPLSGGGDLSANRTITTSMATARLIGRTTAGVGVMEEISVDGSLTLSGGQLSVTTPALNYWTYDSMNNRLYNNVANFVEAEFNFRAPNYIITKLGGGTYSQEIAQGLTTQEKIIYFYSTAYTYAHTNFWTRASEVAKADGDVLTWNDADAVWEAKAVAAGVTSVSNSDTTLTISPTTGAVVASLNLAKANTWTASQTWRAGTTAAGTAPFYTQSGSLLTAAEVGAWEHLTDKIYFTIATGTARKEITLNDTALTSGRVSFATTNGRLTDSANLTYNGSTFGVVGANAATVASFSQPSSGTAITTPFPSFELINTDGTVGNFTTFAFADAVSGAAYALLGGSCTDHASNFGNFNVWTRGANSAAIRMTFGDAGGASATSNFINCTNTFPASLSAETTGALFNYTTAGSSSQSIRAMRVVLSAGYTGSSQTAAMRLENAVAGTGSIIGTGGVTGNLGNSANSTATTAGLNVGNHGFAGGGNANIGVIGITPTGKNSSANIGVMGYAYNTGTGTVTQTGGFFRIGNGAVSLNANFASAALLCDNTDTTDPIFIARDNATTVWSIVDGGTLTAADGMNVAVGTGTGTKIGLSTTSKIGVYNATPVVQGASISDPSGGAIQDAEARTAIIALISRIEAFGIIATV